MALRSRCPGGQLEGPELFVRRVVPRHADQGRLHDLLARAPELVVAGDQLSVDIDPLRELTPEGWSVQLERAQELAPQLPEPALEQSLGMDLGW